MRLPSDYTTEIPLEGRLWLYSAGITESVWKEYNIGYSESMRRVVLPVYNDTGRLIWYQCRALLKGQKPKYLQPRRGRDTVLFQSEPIRRNVQELVIVEDILSAIRVGRFKPAVSLLGTKISTAQCNILGRAKRVNIWLDNDSAGRNGARRIRKAVGLITEVRITQSEVDPKALNDNEIKELLCM